MQDESALVRIEKQTFGPNDTVVLDGKHLVACLFDGCEVAYSGGDFAHEASRFGRPCSLVFYGAAHRTRLVLEWAGFTITSPFGEQPKTKFSQ